MRAVEGLFLPTSSFVLLFISFFSLVPVQVALGISFPFFFLSPRGCGVFVGWGLCNGGGFGPGLEMAPGLKSVALHMV